MGVMPLDAAWLVLKEPTKAPEDPTAEREPYDPNRWARAAGIDPDAPEPHEHDWQLEQAETDEPDPTHSSGSVNTWLVCHTCGAEAGPTNIPITEEGDPENYDPF